MGIIVCRKGTNYPLIHKAFHSFFQDDYSITHISPLLESGGFSYHLIQDSLPEGAVLFDVT